MSQPLADQWTQWGLTGAICGSTVYIPSPDVQLGLGLSAAQPGSLSDLLEGSFQNARFYHARFAAFEEVALQVQVLAGNSRVLKVSSTDGSEVHVLRPTRTHAASATASEPDWYLDRDDPGTVFLQLGDEPRAVVTTEHRSGILVEADGRSVTQLFLALEPETCPPMESPASQWSERLNDPWLQQEVASVLAGSHPLRHVVAVGLLKRMHSPNDDPVQTAKKLLAGDRVGWLARPHEWLRCLSPAQRRTAERLACERSEQLAGEMARGSRLTSDQVLRVLVERDDLEGVRLLLRETGAGQRLDAAIEALDQAASGWQPGNLRQACEGSERLRRARLLDPAAWWAQPTRSEPA
jgi:hypothetical protein